MGFRCRAKIVAGYHLTAEQVEKYLVKTENYDYYHDEMDYFHFPYHDDESDEMVFGIEVQGVGEGHIAERDFFNYVSMSQVRKLIEAFEECFPDLPYNPDLAVKDYLMCEVSY